MASLTLLLCQWVSLSVILALSQAIEWPVQFAWDKAKITDRETHWQRRRVKEAIRIQRSQVRMNLDQGIVLHQAWRRFNIHTSCFSHSAEGHMTGSGNGGKNPL